MKKFEIPEINISLFDAENVITTSNTAVQNAQEAINAVVGEGNVNTTNADEWTLTF